MRSERASSRVILAVGPNRSCRLPRSVAVVVFAVVRGFPVLVQRYIPPSALLFSFTLLPLIKVRSVGTSVYISNRVGDIVIIVRPALAVVVSFRPLRYTRVFLKWFWFWIVLFVVVPFLYFLFPPRPNRRDRRGTWWSVAKITFWTCC